MSVKSVLVIPLGEIPREVAAAAVRRHLGSGSLEWVDRRQPRSLFKVIRRSYAEAVLVTGDVAQSRLRITSFILAITRADRRWRIDVRGNHEAWRTSEHLAQEGPLILRHLLACVLALVVSGPVLTVIG